MWAHQETCICKENGMSHILDANIAVIGLYKKVNQILD